MNEFVDRPLEFYQIPLSTDEKIMRPERVVLIVGKGLSIDFGALCYLRRSVTRSSRRGVKVDLASLSASRAAEIRQLISNASQLFSISGLRVSTLHKSYSVFIQFLYWCDLNQHSDILASETNAHGSLRGYVDELRRLTTQNILSNNTAVAYIKGLCSILENYYDVEYFGRGLNLPKRSDIFEESTLVPDDQNQARVLAWCKCFLIGFSEMIVDHKPFPYSLSIPTYLNWPNDQLWIFPVPRWCELPNSESDGNYSCYDFNNGRLLTYEEIVKKYGSPKYPSDIVHRLIKTHNFIAEANKNFAHRERIARGMLAIQAFLLMFIAATGMNSTQAVELPWSDELERTVKNPIVDRQLFRTIKYRANSKIVFFEIGVEYMPHLRRYLQLRNTLLVGRKSDYLFFSYGVSLSSLQSGPVPMASKTFRQLFATLKRLSPDLRQILPRQWRAAKQDFLIRNHDPATAARVMQHSEQTALKKYSNGSEVTQQIELGSFFGQMEKVVLNKGQNIVGSVARSVGVCIAPQHPQAITADPPVSPNCKGSEGCLFCDKYRAHADETDVRKLLSARHCLRLTTRLATNHEQIDQLFVRILQRIDFILLEIGTHDQQLVKTIEHEVDIDGEMDPFWAAKLETLFELNLL